MISVRRTTQHLNKMVAALRQVPTFTVTRNYNAGTVIVTHPRAGEVFRAIKASRKADLWLIRHKKNLFT